MSSINSLIDQAKQLMEKAIQHLESELTKVRAGKISPNIVDGITVDYYGTQTPLNQVANISTADARTLNIQPWEKKMLEQIEKSILAANIGINPHNDGAMIKLFQPPLTEERRKEYVKKAHVFAEAARVSVRNIRRETNDHIKKAAKDAHLAEDDVKGAEGAVQGLTDKYIAMVEKHLEVKEKEIMTV